MGIEYLAVPTGRPYMQGRSYVVMCPATGRACVIDPDGNGDAIARVLRERDARLAFILLTHGHFDHMGGADDLRGRYGCPMYIHPADADMLESPRLNMSVLTGRPFTCREAQGYVTNGQKIALGSQALEVLHTPGHTPGSVCYLCGGILFSGDTLMAGGYGRTDMPGGDGRALRASLERLFALPGQTLILAGHGEPGTIAGARAWAEDIK